MSKVDELKLKLAALKTSLAEKVDKIGFLRAWREKKQEAQKKGPNPLALSEIYRHGSTTTRLQVLAVYLFGITALVSGGLIIKKFSSRLRSSHEHEKMVKDMTHGLEEAKQHAINKADMVSLGQFTTNGLAGDGSTAMMSLDLWLKVSDPEAATEINTRTAIFRDKANDALNDLFNERVSLVTSEGKEACRNKIKQALNSALPKGHKVEEVFIQSLMIQ